MSAIGDYIRDLALWIDNLTGIRGSSGYILIFLVVFLGHQYMNSHEPPIIEVEKEEEEEPDPPRNFTTKQLLYFDGTKDDKTDEIKPIYMSVNGTVFDVSDGRNFYGPDGPYEMFRGKECGVALAKMSFDAKHIGDLKGCAELNFGEKTELEGWVEKFTYYRNYPIKGRLIPEDDLQSLRDRVLTNDDISKYTGGTEKEKIPEGYATGPIYIGAGDKVFDASFGGVEFYGKGGPYNRFAGKDVSRALAKMSFEPDDISNPSIDDLDEKQKKVLADWIQTFEAKKAYPIVGRLKK